ncbi:hypothetical protein C8Q70DRAFT_979397 [Cubamyces menziesii]|nr:hypothetical protein C8Q70DRAFT_979397 [Cubamyces menziesii]
MPWSVVWDPGAVTSQCPRGTYSLLISVLACGALQTASAGLRPKIFLQLKGGSVGVVLSDIADHTQKEINQCRVARSVFNSRFFPPLYLPGLHGARPMHNGVFASRANLTCVCMAAHALVLTTVRHGDDQEAVTGRDCPAPSTGVPCVCRCIVNADRNCVRTCVPREIHSDPAHRTFYRCCAVLRSATRG